MDEESLNHRVLFYYYHFDIRFMQLLCDVCSVEENDQKSQQGLAFT